MRKLITAGHSYTVQHSGFNQSFMVAMEKHDTQPINIHGPFNTWVLESDFIKLRDACVNFFDAEDSCAIKVCLEQLEEVIASLEQSK